MYKGSWNSKTWVNGSGWSSYDEIDDLEPVEEIPTSADDRDWLEDYYYENYDMDSLIEMADDSDTDCLQVIEYTEIKYDEDGDEYTDREPDEVHEFWESSLARAVLRACYDYDPDEDEDEEEDDDEDEDD